MADNTIQVNTQQGLLKPTIQITILSIFGIFVSFVTQILIAKKFGAAMEMDAGRHRSIRATKNIFASFFIKGGSILVSLLLVRIAIHYVDQTKYGIWITLSSIIAWMSFFDVGLGNGLRNRLAEALAMNQKELARIYISTTYAMLCLIMGSVFLLFIVANKFLDWSIILNAPAEMRKELNLLALIIFGVFCLRFVMALVQTILTADQYPAAASFLPLLGNGLALCVIYFLTKHTNGSLIYLGLTLSIAPTLILLIASIIFFGGRYRPYTPSLKYIRFHYIRSLMNLGVKFFLIQMCVILLYQTSNIIISHLFGPKEVTPYNVAFQYFGVLTMAFSIVLSPFWSATTEAYVRGDVKWIKRSVRNLQLCFVLLVISAFIMFLAADWAYALWVGKSIIIPAALSFSLCLYVIINAWIAIYVYVLNGIGKIQLQLYYGIISSLLSVPLAIFLGHRIGIEGVVLATIGVSGIGVILYPVQYHKIVNQTAYGLWAK